MDLSNIFDFISDGLYKIITFAFSWINIPKVPDSIVSSIDGFLDLIFNNVTLLGFFIRPITLKIVIPILIILLNFDLIYKILHWLLKKIPFLGIE